MVQHQFLCQSRPALAWRQESRVWPPRGRDVVVGPGLFNSNWSLYKTIPFRPEGTPYLELRFEYFNVFNHTEFGGSNNGLDANSGDANFGQVVAAYDPRTLQLGAKLHF